MKKYVCFFILIPLLFTEKVNSEQGKWEYKGIIGAIYNQTDVSSNWSGTEKDSRNWSLKLDVTAILDTEKNNWTNNLKEEFGKSQVANGPEEKTTDLIDFSSVYFWKISMYINPFISFILNTQNQEFFDPVTITESAGLGWYIINNTKQKLNTRLGIAFRQTFDSADYIVDPITGIKTKFSSTDNPSTTKIEESSSKIGGEWITSYELLMLKDMKFTSEARIFNAFEGGVNLRWDNNLYIKTGKYLTLQLGHLTIYNYDKNPNPSWPDDIETRFFMALGVSYNLF